MKPKFKVGQRVVHKSHGPGIITAIEERQFDPDNVTTFYIIALRDFGTTKKIFVPLKSADERLRLPVDDEGKEQILAMLSSAPEDSFKGFSYKQRYHKMMERIRSGDLHCVSEVAAILLQLRKEEKLSFIEHRLLLQCLEIIEAELQVKVS
jgi:RNA polymerase-interacting CarD/CdnL/TRCF family regulator